MNVTFEELRNPKLLSSLKKLYNSTEYKSFKTKYRVAKLVKRVVSEVEIVAKLHYGLVKKYAELDEGGNLLPVNGPGSFRIRGEVVEEYSNELKEFDSISVNIEAYKIPIDDLGNSDLNPPEIDSLFPFLDSGEE